MENLIIKIGIKETIVIIFTIIVAATSFAWFLSAKLSSIDLRLTNIENRR